jgi:solute carrier family 3, member 2
MTKEELMKYANDPFWVKLRWILFIAFWALWIAMLVGAILIIVMAPKCAAPTPLAWFEKGPLITIKENDENIEKMKDLNVQAVIYELPAEETYLVGVKPDIETKIKDMVKKYNSKDIKVVLDLTPNYVPQNDQLFMDAMEAEAGNEILNTFITTTLDINWKKVGKNEKAFVKHGKHTFLSQFGNNIDLRMDSPQVQEKFKNVLTKLVEFGVSGFRLLNAKHLMIGEIADEQVNYDKARENYNGDYAFYNHIHSTYVNGLGDLLSKFTKHVHNITNNEGFLSIDESIGLKGDAFTIKDTKQFGFDLPKIDLIGLFAKDTQSSSSIAAKIFNYFNNFNTTIQPLSNLWMQWQFNKDTYNHLESSAFYMFTSFLRGVQVAPLEAFTEIKEERVMELATAREKAAIQHGSFDYFLSSGTTAFGYARYEKNTYIFYLK